MNQARSRTAARVAGAMTLLAVALAAPAEAQQHQHQHEPSPYAGHQGAEGTALTAEQLLQLRTGEGMGLAIAAETNHHPGPRHVIDLAEMLGLSVEQSAAVEEVRAAMHESAIRIGEEIIEAERELANAFREGVATVDGVSALTARIGVLRGRLQGVHLRAHVETTALLTEAQVRDYDRLRGYASGS